LSQRHDFRQIIADLEAAGWTVHKLARYLKRQHTQIQRIKDGGRVTYPIDFDLIALHASECSTMNITNVTRSQAPMMQMA